MCEPLEIFKLLIIQFQWSLTVVRFKRKLSVNRFAFDSQCQRLVFVVKPRTDSGFATKEKVKNPLAPRVGERWILLFVILCLVALSESPNVVLSLFLHSPQTYPVFRALARSDSFIADLKINYLLWFLVGSTWPSYLPAKISFTGRFKSRLAKNKWNYRYLLNWIANKREWNDCFI